MSSPLESAPAQPRVFSDPCWQAAFEKAVAALEAAECVLAPSEFIVIDDRLKPLEFSWGLQDMKRVAFCCRKADVHRLAPWLLPAAANDSLCTWANDVFVCGATFPSGAVPDAISRPHLASWFRRVQRYRRGKPNYKSKQRMPSRLTQLRTPRRKDVRVLVVGAAGMGNVGDDLLAEVLAELLAEEGARVRFSGPDIDPLRLASYDGIVVGGGGLVYASRDGSNENQNLGNYLRFGPMAQHFGRPAALIGIADQDHAGGIRRDPIATRFARQCLATFTHGTTRDAASATLLEGLGLANVRSGSDLLFLWGGRARRVAAGEGGQSDRFALIGELFCHAGAIAALKDLESLSPIVQGREFDVLVMSNDDQQHAERTASALGQAKAIVNVVDVRQQDFETLARTFVRYRGILTTRFHGLVMAAIVGAPVLALDERVGKKARLLRDIGEEDCLLTADESEHAAKARVLEALEGRVSSIPAVKVDILATQAEVHRAAVRQLIALLRRQQQPRHGLAVSARSLLRRWIRPRARDYDEGSSVGLCWAASTSQTEGFANLGDSLSAVIVAALSGRPVHHVHFDANARKLVAVGSIGHAISNGTAVVWGAGVSIRGGTLARNVLRTRYDVRAIRGPISAQHYRRFGISVPDVYGDPVWFLPSIVTEPVEKKYELGVIPHIQDIAGHHPDAPPKADSLRYILAGTDTCEMIVINTWHEPTWEGLLAKLRLMLSCKRIVSQSFHGLVIAEAYGIPCLNIRAMPAAENGVMQIDLTKECETDPRVWEFYAAGRRSRFPMYAQNRSDRTDWEKVIRSIDRLWEPFEYDAAPLLAAFPLPIAFDPLCGRAHKTEHLTALRF